MTSNCVSVLTDKEVEALREFRRRIPDILSKLDEYHQRDDSLIRWIRARELDLDKAEEMIRNSMKWREEKQIDSIIKDGVDREISKKFPFTLDGYDKTGRPVITLLIGSWDVRTFAETEGVDRFIYYVTQLYEATMGEVRRQTEKIEKNDSSRNNGFLCLQFVVLLDFGGYSYRQLANMKAVRSLIGMVATFEAHYPECLGTAVVINAPTIFSILFGMLKQVMTPRTANKVHVFPAKREQWQPFLLEMIDASQLRPQFGGTK